MAALFSIWQAILMLVALIFFTSYLLDTRLGSILYIKSIGKKLIDNQGIQIKYNRFNKFENKKAQDLPINNKEIAVSLDFEGAIENVHANSIYPSLKVQHNDHEEESLELMGEDVSFIFNRELEVENMVETKALEPYFQDVTGIEELVNDAIYDEQSQDRSQFDSNQLVRDVELPILSFESSPLEEIDREDEEAMAPLEGLEEIPELSFKDLLDPSKKNNRKE